ncbi:hypothetical protein AAFX24_14130 [Vibrio mediterranei]|nr:MULTISPECIES: hypothetical protein [Vibrio]MCF4174919.1 hypothetical protein [Vibrio sp. McD22-P3]MCG9658462.1 hypothetical protein [Vibrio mediterranei]
MQGLAKNGSLPHVKLGQVRAKKGPDEPNIGTPHSSPIYFSVDDYDRFFFPNTRFRYLGVTPAWILLSKMKAGPEV